MSGWVDTRSQSTRTICPEESVSLPTSVRSVNGARTTYSIVEGDPLSAIVRCERVVEVAGRGWSTVTEVHRTMTCDERDFLVETRVRAVDGDTTFFERTWSMTIPRVCG